MDAQSQHTSAVLPRIQFHQERERPDRHFPLILRFFSCQFQACAHVTFHSMVTPFLFKYGVSIFICYVILLAIFPD